MSTTMNRLARRAMSFYPFPRGQGRVIDRTFLHALPFPERTLRVRTRDGFSMTVFPNDHIGRHLYLTGQFDRTIVELLLHLGRPGDRVLDIGANVGYVSCAVLAGLAGSRVVAVEPQPEVFAVLEQNVLAVGGERAVAVRAAVSTRSGSAALETVEGNTGKGRLVDGEGARSRGAVMTVPLVSGTELMQAGGMDGLELVKIDVEGHETEVLRTLEPVIARSRPRAVVFEHVGPLHAPAHPIVQLFGDLGYQIRALRKSVRRWRLVPENAPARRPARDHVAQRGGEG